MTRKGSNLSAFQSGRRIVRRIWVPRLVAIAVSIDGQEPQVVRVYAPSTEQGETFLGRQLYENTRNNMRIMRFQQTVDAPGKRTLKITMLDPSVVLQKNHYSRS